MLRFKKTYTTENVLGVDVYNDVVSNFVKTYFDRDTSAIIKDIGDHLMVQFIVKTMGVYYATIVKKRRILQLLNLRYTRWW